MVYKRKDKKTPYYLYDFRFRGVRYQGTTKLTNVVAARRFEAALIEKVALRRGAGILGE